MTLARFQPVVLGLLYHISIEDKFKSLFTYTECIPRMYDMLTRVQVRVHVRARVVGRPHAHAPLTRAAPPCASLPLWR